MIIRFVVDVEVPDVPDPYDREDYANDAARFFDQSEIDGDIATYVCLGGVLMESAAGDVGVSAEPDLTEADGVLWETS